MDHVLGASGQLPSGYSPESHYGIFNSSDLDEQDEFKCPEVSQSPSYNTMLHQSIMMSGVNDYYPLWDGVLEEDNNDG